MKLTDVKPPPPHLSLIFLWADFFLSCFLILSLTTALSPVLFLGHDRHAPPQGSLCWKGSPACSKVTSSQGTFLSMQLQQLVPLHLSTCFLYLPGFIISITIWQGLHLFVRLLPYSSMPLPKSTREQGFGVFSSCL